MKREARSIPGRWARSSRDRGRAALAAAVSAAAIPALSEAAPAGRVNFAIGPVVGKSEVGTERPLTRGSMVNTGDTIITNRGRVQIRFNDGGYMALRPRTEFRIDEFDYERRAGGRRKSVFSLLRGGLRTLTGLIGKRAPDDYQLRTRVATIGIRGTGFSVIDCAGLAAVCSALKLIPESPEERDPSRQGVSGGDHVPLPVVGRNYEGVTEWCQGEVCRSGGPGTSFHYTAQQGETQKPGEPSSPPIQTAQDDAPGLDAETPVAGEQTNADGTSQLVGGRLADGPGYDIVIAYGEGDDGDGGFENTAVKLGTNVTATFAGGVALQSYDAGQGSAGGGLIGGATDAEPSVTRDIGWGRWTQGTTVKIGSRGVHPMTFAGTQSQHYAIGFPTADMPSGTASYVLVDGTTPTLAKPSSGNIGVHQLTSAAFSANFDTNTVLFSASVRVAPSGTATTLAVSGLPLTINGNQFSGSGTLSSGCAASSCSADAAGFFSGAAAAAAAVGYKLATGAGDYANGVVKFSKQ